MLKTDLQITEKLPVPEEGSGTGSFSVYLRGKAVANPPGFAIINP